MSETRIDSQDEFFHLSPEKQERMDRALGQAAERKMSQPKDDESEKLTKRTRLRRIIRAVLKSNGDTLDTISY